MHIKITTPQQVVQLLKGDVLLKYPQKNDPGNTDDEQYPKSIEAYEIRYINMGNEMIELVMTADSRVSFASPGDIGRLFIKSGHLITEGVWWLQ
jgi:hypothetical protein